MNILYVCGDDPRLTTSGSKLRTHFLWKALSSFATVYTVVTDVRYESCEGERIHVVDFESKSQVCRAGQRLFLRFTKCMPWPFRNVRVLRDKIGWRDVRFDRVVTRYMRNASLCSAWKFAPLVCDIDDLPLQAFLQLAKHNIPFGLRTISEALLRLTQRYVLGKCRGVFVVKDEDLKYIPRGVEGRLLPNLAPPPKADYAVEGKQQKIVLTVGMMGYDPNREGVDWFLRDVWPTFYQQHPDCQYWIAGGGAPKEVVDRWNTMPGVKALGFVDDLDAVYETASFVVAPILTGAGTCIKVMESCLRGRETLVTKVASRGYDVDVLKLVLFDDGEAFLKRANAWLEMPESSRLKLQNSVADAARNVNSVDRFGCIVREGVLK